MVRLLFIATKDSPSSQVDFAEEHRRIKNEIASTTAGRTIEIDTERAVRDDELGKLIIKHKPSIVHISGHASHDGLRFFDENAALDEHGYSATYVDADQLAHLFSAIASKPRILLLSNCYSETLARRLTKHVDFVVGILGEVEDKVAIAFARGFYSALGEGSSAGEAFGHGQYVAERQKEGCSSQFVHHTRAGLDIEDIILSDATTAAITLASLHRSTVPTLPNHYQPHTALQAAITAAILGAQWPQRCAAILGSGGMGKTVLATAIARSSSVTEHFGPNIFWASFGEEPSLTAIQLQLIRTIELAQGIDISADEPGYLTEGRRRLEHLLTGENLLIFDDIWKVSHLDGFPIPEGSRGLITTRKLEVVSGLSARKYDMTFLEDGQARALLAGWADEPELPQAAQDVVEKCAKVPIALAMIGGLARKKKKKADTMGLHPASPRERQNRPNQTRVTRISKVQNPIRSSRSEYERAG